MIEYEILDQSSDKTELVNLNIEYITWVDKKLELFYNIQFFDLNDNIEEQTKNYVEESIEKMFSKDKPKSRYILARNDHKLVGMGILHQLTSDIVEIKRMYIKEEFRNKGFGLNLLTKLLQIGLELDFKIARLDSAKFMESAHKLYLKAGFYFINPYSGSEIPIENQKYSVFMEKKLN